jgi:hypothetical protein
MNTTNVARRGWALVRRGAVASCVTGAALAAAGLFLTPSVLAVVSAATTAAATD